MAQLSPASFHSLCGCTEPHCVCHFVLIPLPGTLSNQAFPVLLKSCLAGVGATDTALSQEPCCRPSGCQTWGCSHPGPCTGLKDLIVLKHSPYCLIFQCSLQFLISSLHTRWGTIGCSLCSSEDWLGVSPMHRVKWTPLPPISPPSSSLLLDCKTEGI